MPEARVIISDGGRDILSRRLRLDGRLRANSPVTFLAPRDIGNLRLSIEFFGARVEVPGFYASSTSVRKGEPVTLDWGARPVLELHDA
jgi:hypothetical protein